MFNTLSFAVRLVGVLVAMAWVARSLGPERQGRFGFVHWMAAILAQMSLWGLGAASTRYVAQALGADNAHRAHEAVRLATRWLLVTLACVGVLATLLSWFLGGELRTLLLAAIPLLLTAALYQWRIGVAWGLRRFDIALVGHLVFFGALMPLLYVALGHEEPIAATLLAFGVARGLHAAVVWIGASRVLRRLVEEAGTPDPDADEAPPLAPLMRSYALQMAVVAFFGALLWERSELPFLRVSADFEQIGFYTAAFAVAVLFLRVPGVMAQVVLPVVAEMEGARVPPEEIGAMFRRAARLVTLLVATPVAILCAAAPVIVEALYGPEYAESAELLRILVLPLVLAGAGAAGGKTLVGSGNQHLMVRIAAGAACLKLLLCLILVAPLEARGAAIAVAIAFGAALLAEAWAAARTFPAKQEAPSSRWLAQAGVAGAGAAGALLCAWLFASSTVWLQVVGVMLGGGALAFVAAIVLRPITSADAGALERVLRSGGMGALVPVFRRVSG